MTTGGIINKTPTTITTANGKQSTGYIDNGKTYYSNGTRIENGAKVTDNSGREWQMTSKGGVATGNNYSIGGNQGAYKATSGGGYNSTSSSYYDTYQGLLNQQLRTQQNAINKQTQATVDSIEAYRPQVNQAYEQQQKENYIANQKAQYQMGDFSSAMGYSGGITESLRMDANNTYQNNRTAADTEKNYAMSQINQQVAHARATGDTNLANAMDGYYSAYLSALQNEQQMDYQKQLQEKEDYANTIGAYSNDYKAQIDRLIAAGVPEDDYRIKLLWAARNEKISNIEAAAAEAEQQNFDNYYKQQQLNNQTRQTNYNVSKPIKASSGGNGGGITFAQAVQAYKLGIETPEVLKRLGLPY